MSPIHLYTWLSIDYIVLGDISPSSLNLKDV